MITMQPAPATVNVGQTARFSATATGNTPLRYQWRKNGANIAGATRRSYTTPAATAEDDGSLFSVVVTNAIGSVTSGSALLTVDRVTPPAIISGARMANQSAGRPPQHTRLPRRRPRTTAPSSPSWSVIRREA